MARTYSNVFRATVVDASVAAVPAWRSGMSVGQWKELPGSSLSLAPSYIYAGQNSISGKQDAWCCWAIDQRTGEMYSLWNGGHGDYFPNEVDKFDPRVDVPAWVELLGPTSEAQCGPNFPNSYNAPHYLDGRPVARHSYQNHYVIESLNLVMAFGVGSGSKEGNPWPNVDSFDILTNTCAPANTHASLPFTGLAGGGLAMAKHPDTENMYVWNQNYDLAKWTKTTGVWTNALTENPPVSTNYCPAIIDPTRGATGMMHVAGTRSGVSYDFDLSIGRFTQRILTGALAIQVAGTYSAMVHETTLGLYLFRSAAAVGGDVLSINPNDWSVSAFSTTGGSGIPAASVVSGGHALCGRFLYAPTLGGCFLGPQWSSNIWFLRTH